MNLQTGAFGDPAATETLILFWTKMEELHYPGAAATRAFLEERQQREMSIASAAAAAQVPAGAGAISAGGQPPAEAPPALRGDVERKIDAQARQDAEQTVMGQSGVII